MKDGQAAIKEELRKEHEARYEKLEKTAEQTEKNKKNIKTIESHLNLVS